MDEEEADAQDRTRDVADNHQQAPIQTVGQQAAQGRSGEVGQVLRADHEGYREPRRRQALDQLEQSDQKEPVASKRDQRSDVQVSEVTVPAEQRPARPDAISHGAAIRHSVRDYRYCALGDPDA